MNRHPITLKLDAARLNERQEAFAFLREAFELPETLPDNLDALSDSLSEIPDEICIFSDRKNLIQICENKFSWTILRILVRAADENPHIHIRLS